MPFILTLLLILVQDTPLTIRFIGNEAFEISDGRTTLLTDYPYLSGAFGYMTYDAKSIQPKGDIILLITHGHADHFDPSLVRDSSWRIVAPRSVTHSLSNKQVIPLDSVISARGIKIYPISSDHGGIEHYSYLVEWGGRRLYFAGDTNEPKELMDQGDLDYAFVSPWLHSAISSGRFKIPARHIVIYHHTDNEQIPNCTSCWIPKQNESIRTSLD